jgi:serine/threonine protein phosphatase PrpC
MSGALSAARNARPDHLGAFKFLSVGLSHVGCVRTLNEDALLNRPDIGLWAVADGMGGHAHGDVASARVIAALDSVDAFSSAYAFRDGVAKAVESVNRALFAEPLIETTGSTVVTLMAHDGHFACLWAGDSRAYLYRAGRLRRLTRDHSVIQDLLDQGAISPDEARRHPKSNIITRAVGAHATLQLDDAFGMLQHDDRFLLCSDGLCAAVGDAAIAEAMRRAPLEAGAQALINQALAAGGEDNISVVLVAVGAAPSVLERQVPAPEANSCERRMDRGR